MIALGVVVGGVVCGGLIDTRQQELEGITRQLLSTEPDSIGKKSYYVAEGTWNLLGGYGGGANLADPHFGLVAGACFEAIHNALAAWLVRRWALPKNGRRPNRTQN